MIVALGFLNWLLCFLSSLVLLPLEIVSAWLAQLVLGLLIVVTTACCLWPYLRQSFVPSRRESLIVGFAWMLIALALDFPARILTEAYTPQAYVYRLAPFTLLIFVSAAIVGIVMKQLAEWRIHHSVKVARSRRRYR